MVSRAYYPPPPPHAHDGLRYLPSRSSAPYLSYPERRYQLASHDPRAITMADPQNDETTPPRKRIAVACGRCRKRKIRCSGDPGGGQPCVNCKNAGVDQCLFLRVQSQEAPMRDEGRYEYNLDVSRSLAQRSTGSMAHMSSSMTQYPQDMHLLSSGGLPPSYRSSAYPSVGSKGYLPLGADWTDTYGADAGVDYGLSCPPYQVINSDPVHMVSSYGHWPTITRQKGGSQGGSGVYMDSDSGYAYGTGSSTTSLVHRPAPSVPGDSSAYSFAGIAASLPSASNERLLPTPVSRGLGSSGTNYRVADGLPSSGYGASKASHGSSVSGGATGQASPVPSLSDVTAAAAAAGYGSSVYEYTTTGRSSQHHGSNSSADAYGSVSSGAGETIFGESDRSAATQGPGVDLTAYTYGAAVSPAETSRMRRASSGSGLTSRPAAEGSSSSPGYIGNDSGASATHGSGAYHHSSSSSHGHNHHQHHAVSQHASPRHGSHHLPQQQHAVTGSTAYGGASSGSGHAGSGLSGGGVGNTSTVTDSHRASVVSRR